MTPQAVALVAVLGVLVWTGLALCFGVAIGLTIRSAERQRIRPTGKQVDESPAPSPGRVHHELYGEWLGAGDPSAIRPPAVPPRLDVRL